MRRCTATRAQGRVARKTWMLSDRPRASRSGSPISSSRSIGTGQIAHLDDGLRHAGRHRVAVAPRIEGVVVAHPQADVVVVARQLRVGGVDLIQGVHQPIVDVGQRAEAGPGDFEAVAKAVGVAVGVQGDERVGAIGGRHRRRQHVDVDAAGLEQRRCALGDVEIDLPLLLAAADAPPCRRPSSGGTSSVSQWPACRPTWRTPGRVVQRGGRQRLAERAEEVLRARRARGGQRIGPRRVVAGGTAGLGAASGEAYQAPLLVTSGAPRRRAELGRTAPPERARWAPRRRARH